MTAEELPLGFEALGDARNFIENGENGCCVTNATTKRRQSFRDRSRSLPCGTCAGRRVLIFGLAGSRLARWPLASTDRSAAATRRRGPTARCPTLLTVDQTWNEKMMKAHGSQATLAAWSSGTTSATKHKDCGFESSQDPTIKEFQKEGC